jgi:hypothetical protein
MFPPMRSSPVLFEIHGEYIVVSCDQLASGGPMIAIAGIFHYYNKLHMNKYVHRYLVYKESRTSDAG